MKKVVCENYSVKKIKQNYHSEGRWFAGTLYFNNKPIAEFEEHGYGGPMDIHYNDSDKGEDFTSFAKITLGEEYHESDAILIEEMVNSEFSRKDIQRDRNKKTHFALENRMEYVIASPYSERLVAHLKEKYPSLKTIGNEEFDIYPDGVERVVQVGKE